MRPCLPDERSGILSFRPPDGLSSALISAALRRRGVVATTPDGLLRFAPHLLNRIDDTGDVAAHVRAAVREVRGG